MFQKKIIRRSEPAGGNPHVQPQCFDLAELEHNFAIVKAQILTNPIPKNLNPQPLNPTPQSLTAKP